MSSIGRTRRSERIFKQSGLSKFKNTPSTSIVIEDVVNAEVGNVFPLNVVSYPLIEAQSPVIEEGNSNGSPVFVGYEETNVDDTTANEFPITDNQSEKEKTTQANIEVKKYTRNKVLEEVQHLIEISDKKKSVFGCFTRSSKRKSVCDGVVDDCILVKVAKPKKFLSIRTRMSPHSLFIALNNLSLGHKLCLKEMGFGGLYKMPCDGVPAHIGHFVVDNFNPRNMTLKLKNGLININEGVVSEILGIPCGDLNLCDLNELPMDNRPLINHWFSQFPSRNKVRASDICKAIVNSSEAGIMFKLNFLILFSNTMVGCPSSGSCGVKVLKFVDEFVDISAVNWCRYLLDSLAHSKSGWDKYGSRLYGGPLTFLVLLYLDYVKFDLYDIPRARPAIQSWSMDKMKTRQEHEMKEGGFGIWDLQPDYNELIMNEDVVVDDMVRKLQSKFSVLLDDKDDILSYLQEVVHKFPLPPKILDFKELFKSVFV